MTGPTPPELEGLLAAAERGDPDAMYELGMHWTRVAAAARDNARSWLRAGARTGSLDARVALAAQHVADGEYREAQWQLQVLEIQHPEATAARRIGIAPNVLGPHLRVDGDGETDVGLFAVFTIITTYPQQAAAALDEIRDRLLDIDGRGILTPSEERAVRDVATLPLTPRYVAEIESNWLGARVLLDTRGFMSAAMGRTIISTIIAALVDAEVPAVIGGRCAELDAQFVPWREMAVGC